ncbi:MAG: hypothetical protein ACFFHD_13695 [Promethearchaeota archaeon]
MLEKELDKMDLILDYYKDWDSYKTPVMMTFDKSKGFNENIENIDERRQGFLWSKYRKSSR